MGRGDHMHEDKLGVPLNYLSPLRQDFSLAWSSTKIAEILQSPPSLRTMTTTATPQFCLLIHWRMYKFILYLVLCKYYTTHESAGTSSKCTNFTSFVFMLRIGITVSSIYLFLNFFSFKMLIVYIYCTKGHFHINTCYLFKFF